MVIIDNTSNLISARFIILFDATIVEVVDITTSGSGYIFTDSGIDVIELERDYDNENGTIIVSVGGLKENFTGVSGNGIVACITFKGEKTGSSNLSFDTSQSDNVVFINYLQGNGASWGIEDLIIQNGVINVK